MVVSLVNGGYPNSWMVCNGTILKWMTWGYLHFRKPPYVCISNVYVITSQKRWHTLVPKHLLNLLYTWHKHPTVVWWEGLSTIHPRGTWCNPQNLAYGHPLIKGTWHQFWCWFIWCKHQLKKKHILRSVWIYSGPQKQVLTHGYCPFLDFSKLSPNKKKT